MMTSKQLLIKPLTLSDSQILDLVCKFNQVHETGSEESSSFNVQALFSVVSTIMNRSLIGDVDTGHGTTIEEDHHKAMPDNFEPPTRMLKHISCQVSGEDNLGRSLALLYHVHVFQKNLRSATGSDYNHIVENAFETVKRIIELQSLLNEGHEEESVPSLTEAKHEFPVFVYWVVLTIVACALHFKFLLGHREAKYNLSYISCTIFAALSKIKALLGRIRKEIDHVYGSPESSKGLFDISIEDLDIWE
ncbi:uncharacterized protein LOC129321081 isoform X3 [Prosopis cineraria]|uniref:uncharacterized protein LOC129321081 isoform X3 n=1 Tax=Prosopis cineraria TaxID=364024 RepID=UPI00240F1D59|nr:uncharacterized protein LOC129321081 isoform X3 [Prosopis cineraria]